MLSAVVLSVVAPIKFVNPFNGALYNKWEFIKCVTPSALWRNINRTISTCATSLKVTKLRSSWVMNPFAIKHHHVNEPNKMSCPFILDVYGLTEKGIKVVQAKCSTLKHPVHLINWNSWMHLRPPTRPKFWIELRWFMIIIALQLLFCCLNWPLTPK